MKYLIDTQILIWFDLSSPRLKSNILDILVNPKNKIFVPQVSLFEIAVKQNIGKLPELLWTTEVIAKQMEKDGFELLKIENSHIQRFINLPVFDNHRDPFDRLIIASALTENLTIISTDEKFKLYLLDIQLIEA